MTDMIRKSDAIAVCRYDDARDCRDAIAALPAVTVGVKPLVWEFEQEDVQVANTSVRHQYRIVFDHRATVGAWMWFCEGRWICCETEEAAKAAAQADYTARILAALTPTPVDASRPADPAVNAPDPAAIWRCCECGMSMPCMANPCKHPFIQKGATE